MEKNSIKSKQSFISEEEQTLEWNDVLNSFKKNFGTEIYSSWLKDITFC